MSTTIDNLQIEIKSSSVDAAQGIDALAKSLGNLKKSGTISTAVKNLNNLSASLRNLPNVHGSSTALRTLANSVEKLKSVGSISTLTNSLSKLPVALNALKNINLDGVGQQIVGIVNALSPLSNVKAGGLGTTVNALRNLGKVTESLDDDTIGAFAKKIEILTEKLEPLSTKMTTVSAGFKSINSAAKSAAVGVDNLSDKVNVTTFNLANMITVIHGVMGALQPIIDLLSAAIGASMEWDGIKYQFGNAFGEQADEYYEKITKITDALDINKQTFMELSSMSASMLIGYGVEKTDAREMGLGYAELAYDIWAAYNNVYKTLDGADGAMAAVRSAISGETEPIRRAGFTIVDTQLAITAANHGLAYSTTEATEAQKSYLRYLTLVDQAQNKGVIGTYAREMETAEGMTRTLTQQLKTLAQAFGSLFIPILVRVLPYVQAFVELLTEGVHWLASLFGVEIQDISNGWNDFSVGAEGATENTEKMKEQLEKSRKEAEKLKNAVLGIDELNVISPTSGSGKDDSDGNGGNGGWDNLNGIDSIWNQAILDSIEQDVDRIKEKMRGWLPIIASVSTALAGLRLIKLLKDIEAIAKLSGGVAAVGGALKGIGEYFKAAKQNAPFVGWFAALAPRLSSWIAGLPALLSSAASALAVAAPWIGIAIAVVGGITLALVDYDFTDVGYTVGKKVGEAMRWAIDGIVSGVKKAFNWVKDALDIDDIWDVFAVLFIPGEWIRRITPELKEIFDGVSDWLEKKIENLKGNINEFFDGFFDGLFDGLGVDTAWLDKFTEMFDIEYLDIVNAVMNPTSIGKHIATGIWNSMDSNTKTSALKDKIVSMWNTAKSWWDKKPSLKSYTPSIGSIYDKLKPRWDSAREWWNNKKSAMKTYTPSIGSIYEKVYDRWKNARDWWNSKKGSFKTYTPSIGSITDKLKSAWNSAKSWWSKNVKLSTKLNISVPTIKVKWETASAFGKSFKYPTGFNLKFAAAGGVFDQGSLIWAGERGPEVMANASGGRTGVMNIEQMQEAVYEGVYSAMIAAMRGNSEGGGQDIRVYLDSREITASVERRQRERGASIMGNQVYSY